NTKENEEKKRKKSQSLPNRNDFIEYLQKSSNQTNTNGYDQLNLKNDEFKSNQSVLIETPQVSTCEKEQQGKFII
ncbi:unnamed protein product, partial [Didymodactylos carnosus]